MSYTEEQYDEFRDFMHKEYPAMFSGPYGGFCIGPGWWPIIKSLCRQIQGHIDWNNKTRKGLLEDNPRNHPIPDEIKQVVVQQIKEKFGGLRFYYNGGDDTIHGMVRIAESWAAHSCEECGNLGTPSNSGWVKTLCEKHQREREERYKD